MYLFPKHQLMDGAAGDAGGGAGGGAGATGAGGDAAGGAPSAGAAAPAGQGASLLAQGGADKPLGELVPEKFRTMKDDGTLDSDASLRKVLGSYTELEKRFGSSDAPPKTPEEYKLEGLPDGVDLAALTKDEKYVEFVKGAHAKGLTSAQVSFVLNEAISRGVFAAKDGEGEPMTSEKAGEELRSVWKDDKTFNGNVTHAYKAAAVYAERAGLKLEDIEAAGLGNNPTFLRIMAAIGPELKEDSPPLGHQSGAAGGEDIKAARLQLASMSPKDPAYAALRARVDGWYNKHVGTEPVR